MIQAIQPSHLLAIALAGWLNRQQEVVTDYLIEESVFLRISVVVHRFFVSDEIVVAC